MENTVFPLTFLHGLWIPGGNDEANLYKVTVSVVSFYSGNVREDLNCMLADILDGEKSIIYMAPGLLSAYFIVQFSGNNIVTGFNEEIIKESPKTKVPHKHKAVRADDFIALMWIIAHHP